MKKLCLILLSLVIVISASAQRKYSGRYYSRPSRVIVSYGWGYPYYPYYYPYGLYYPYPPYYRESRLDMQIDDIKAEYKDKIKAVRHDKSLSKSERRSKIDQLKSQREEAILDARKNYYKSP